MTEVQEVAGGTSLAVPAPIVLPPMNVDQILNHFKKIQELKQRLVDPETDVIKIAEKPYILKSGWRKLAFAFNLSDEIVREEREDKKDGEVVYRIWVRVTAPNGRSVVAVGCASSKERKFAHEAHDPYALAHTRAKNRAISDVLGLGEVSGEEMVGAEPKEGEGERKAEAPAPKTIDSVPPGGEFLTQKGKPYGWIKRTEHGAELYFDPPLDMGNGDVRHIVENFLYARVLEGIKSKVEEENAKNGTDHIFEYTPIVEGAKLQGISFSADPEALTEPRFREIKSSSAWTAARAAEKQ